MALLMPDKRDQNGTPITYWVIRGFAMHDEVWPLAKANDPGEYGPLRQIPGTKFCRVKILQIKLEGYRDKDAADGGSPSLKEYVFHVLGAKADAVWEVVKAGDGNTLAALYARLKATAEEKAARKLDFPVRNATDS